MQRIITLLISSCLLLVAHSLAAQDTVLLRFGVIADVQYAEQPNRGTRYYRQSPAKLKEAVDSFNNGRVDFVISLGDFIDNGFAHFDTLNRIMAKLKMPVYHVLGNHDFLVSPEKRHDVLSALAMPARYYSFERKSYRFIQLDGNDISTYGNDTLSVQYKAAKTMLDSMKAVHSTNAFEWNGGIGTSQLTWLKEELSKAKQQQQKVIISCHFPIYPDSQKELLLNASEVRKLVEAFPNVIAWLNGHTHASYYSKVGNVNYIGFRGMVEQEYNSFAIVSIYSSHIEIAGYGKETSSLFN